MTESSASFEQRTPQQHEAVRRRALLVSLCGVVCGVAGLLILLSRTIDVARPPAVFAVNLSFCAMMMGIGILFYARGTPGTRWMVAACLLAIAAGLAGPLVFARQSMDWHIRVENCELGNVEAIATASLQYARNHEGNYPTDLVALLQAKTIGLEIIRSPFGSMQKPGDVQRMGLELQALDFFQQLEGTWGVHLSGFRQIVLTRLSVEVDTLSDYQYFGVGLRLPEANSTTASSPANPFGALPEEIILATSRNAIMRKQISVGFVNERALFLNLSSAESALLASNDARTSAGFSAIRPPEVIRRAQDIERRQPNRK